MMFRNILATLAASWLAAGAAFAQLPEPQGRALLIVTGEISEMNSATAAHFDMDMLRGLDWVEVESYTSFTEGPQMFSGPTLASVLAAVGANGANIRATALNGYHVKIPAAHAAQHDVILAVELNGKRMRVRDKGPIWVVYPMSEAEAQQKPFDSEMIWQLQSLTIEP